MAAVSGYAAAGLITTYQRFISPYKGFCCAHRALHREASCSEAVKKLVMKYGMFRAWPFIVARFEDCRTAHFILMAKNKKKRKKTNKKENSNECFNALWWTDTGLQAACCCMS